jgi:hypothetical protein
MLLPVAMLAIGDGIDTAMACPKWLPKLFENAVFMANGAVAWKALFIH